MSNNNNKPTLRVTWGELFKRLLRMFLVSVVSVALVVGSFMIYDSKFWRYYIYQNKVGFYFEKYRTAAEAKQALDALYPEGTNIEMIKKDIESAGGWIPTSGLNSDHIVLSYFEKDDSFFYRESWLIQVHFDTETNLSTFLEVEMRIQTY